MTNRVRLKKRGKKIYFGKLDSEFYEQNKLHTHHSDQLKIHRRDDEEVCDHEEEGEDDSEIETLIFE